MSDQAITPPDNERLKQQEQQEQYNKNLYAQYAMQAAQTNAQLTSSLFSSSPLYTGITTSGTTWTSDDITNTAYAAPSPTITTSTTMEAGWRYVTWKEEDEQGVTVQVVPIISWNVMSDGTMTYTLAGQNPILSTKVKGVWLGVLGPGEPYEQDAEAQGRWAVKAEEASREQHAAQVARKLLKKAR